VASNIEGVDELVEDDRTGLLFRAGNAVELSRQLERLLSDPDLGCRLARSSREFIVNAGLLWSETARRYEALYRELINASCAD
jgi:glycosyltransferase involved in cell wall biosynthesis